MKAKKPVRTAADIYLEALRASFEQEPTAVKRATKKRPRPIRLDGGCLLYRFPKTAKRKPQA